MPSGKKITWASLRVGLLAIAAMSIAAVLIFLLTGSSNIFTPTGTLRTYMSDSAGMISGTPVRLNGILIGQIATVQFSGSKDPQRVVEITMTVKRQFLRQIPADSVAAVSAANLLGDKFINITKGHGSTTVRDGAEIKSLQTQDIPELMTQSAAILQQFQTTLRRVDDLLGDIVEGKGNIGKFLKDEQLYNSLNAAAGELHKIVVQLNTGGGTLGKLLYDDTLYQEIRGPVGRLDDLLSNLQQGKGTAGKLLNNPALYEDARSSIADLRRIIEDVKAGKGTAGRLLKDDELYRQINRLVAKLDTTLDKMSSGQGTLGQLMVNPQLYEALNGATRELQALFKDMRANPKKFLRVKLALF